MTDSLDNLCINTIRTLAMDMVQKANSGHPGSPMGAASIAYVLWDRFLKHNHTDPAWPCRARFVLSPGHASALLYSFLHLTGYDLSLDDLKQFHQWESQISGQSPTVVGEGQGLHRGRDAAGLGALRRPGRCRRGSPTLRRLGPRRVLYERFGLTAERLVEEATRLLSSNRVRA